MPIYCFETKSGKVVERFFPIGGAPRTIQVGRHVARRSFRSERKSIPAAAGWPFECLASGVNANQAGELRDLLCKKGVPTEVTADGNPVYRDAAHRRKALKARGMFDRTAYV
jgi:hypothetical protein